MKSVFLFVAIGDTGARKLERKLFRKKKKSSAERWWRIVLRSYVTLI